MVLPDEAAVRGMNKDIDPLTRTHDAGLNAARTIPGATADQIATWAVLMNKGLMTFEQILHEVMRARALPPPQDGQVPFGS